MYSLGAIVVTILSGTQLQKITERAFDDIPAMRELDLERIYDDPNCPYISPEAKTFIKGLLCYQQERFDVKQARESPWLSRHATLLDSIYKRAIAGWSSRSTEMKINKWIDGQPCMNTSLQDDCLSKSTSNLHSKSLEDSIEQSLDRSRSDTIFPTPRRRKHNSIQDTITEEEDFSIHEDGVLDPLLDASVPSDVLIEIKPTPSPEQSAQGTRIDSNTSAASPIVSYVQRRQKRQRRYETVSYDDEIEQENDEELAKTTHQWMTAKVVEDKRKKIVSVYHTKKTKNAEQKGDFISPLR